MKSFLAICVVAVAIATFTIPAEAQSTSPPASASQPGAITLPTLPPTELPSIVPFPKHGCNCKETCEAVQHSQVPYKDNPEDAANYLSYESYPISCRDAAARFLQPLGGEKPAKKYICKQTFDCCRKCNSVFYTCLEDHSFGACLRAAYKCMCHCFDDKPNKELPYKK